MSLLVDSVGIGPGSGVLDVASGTGKLTGALVAAEPSASLRSSFAPILPGVAQMGADAASLPFAASSFDARTVARAFHWFDTAEVLAGFARVLRPGGGLALIGNERAEADRSSPHSPGSSDGTCASPIRSDGTAAW
jgi:ubiquinone/menaquinone biosynthesis C-methylase UbiE